MNKKIIFLHYIILPPKLYFLKIQRQAILSLYPVNSLSFKKITQKTMLTSAFHQIRPLPNSGPAWYMRLQCHMSNQYRKQTCSCKQRTLLYHYLLNFSFLMFFSLSYPPIIIFVFLLLTRFFLLFHFFIDELSKSMPFPQP